MKNLVLIALGLIWMLTACKTIPKQEVDPYSFNIETRFYKFRNSKHPIYVLKVINSKLIAVCNNENDSTQISIKLNKADLDSIQYLTSQISIGDTGWLWMSHSWGANMYINEQLLYNHQAYHSGDTSIHNKLILFLRRKSPVNIDLYGFR
jgi:hypothetical protein